MILCIQSNVNTTTTNKVIDKNVVFFFIFLLLLTARLILSLNESPGVLTNSNFSSSKLLTSTAFSVSSTFL